MTLLCSSGFRSFSKVSFSLEVKYLGKNAKGKIQLSRKEVLEERRRGKKPLNVIKKSKVPKSQMSKEEVDVISQAIEGIQNL